MIDIEFNLSWISECAGLVLGFIMVHACFRTVCIKPSSCGVCLFQAGLEFIIVVYACFRTALTCSEAMCNAAELEPALKGYGAKIRAPHALVMTFLFKSGSLKDKLKAIFQATFTHSRNLAYFVFTYKSILTAQEKIHGSKWQFHSFLAACVGGWVVFGENNTINSQINMYLLSRVLFGMSRLAVEKGFIPEPKCDVFPFFSALVWGLVLWMFEYHRHTLQPSLQSSMTYLYDDSNIWHDISDFLIYNKPKQEK
ncbi:peroxisomal membrane protein 4-like [Mantella aurantiaca]